MEDYFGRRGKKAGRYERLPLTVFGINFADDRIKSYSKEFFRGTAKGFGMGSAPPPPDTQV